MSSFEARNAEIKGFYMAVYKLLFYRATALARVMAEVEKIAAWFTREGIVRFEIEKGLVGGAAYDVHKTAISDADMARAQAADAVLLAAVGGPKWDAVPYEVRPKRVFCGFARI